MEWNAFAFWYNLRKYSDDEQKAITAITDQLIEDDDRRRRGDFYTPAIWVNESQKLLDQIKILSRAGVPSIWSGIVLGEQAI